MENISITVKQQSAIYEYAEWLASNPVPCDDCIARQDSVICDGCDQQLNWIENRSIVKSAFRSIVGDELSTSPTVQRLVHLYVERIRLEKQLEEIKEKIYDNSNLISSLGEYISVHVES